MQTAVQEARATISELRKPAEMAGGNGSGGKPPVRMLIPLEQLKPNPEQVRQNWDTSKDEAGKTALDRLADSIRNQGLLSELVVTPQGDHYLIVCGERRYRAIKNNNLMKEVPCVVRVNLTPVQMLEMNLVENLQREDLTPIDEANAYKALLEKCGYTQAALAAKLGISGAMISYKLSLLDLTPPLQKMVATGKLSETDGRSIAQTVKRIEGPQKEEQRAQALQTIENEVAKAPTNEKTGKIETPAVKRVAEQAVTQVAGASALPQVRAPRMVAPAPAPTPAPATKVSAAVKEQAEHLLAVIKDVTELLRPARKALADKALRQQVIRCVLDQQPTLPSKIQAAISPLDVIHAEAREMLNAKAQPTKQAPKEAPAKNAGKGQAKAKKSKAPKAAKKTAAKK
ncbi:MAG: ParB/RepB/Spo0J family partition protein [Planctomycetota bacterium]